MERIRTPSINLQSIPQGCIQTHTQLHNKRTKCVRCYYRLCNWNRLALSECQWMQDIIIYRSGQWSALSIKCRQPSLSHCEVPSSHNGAPSSDFNRSAHWFGCNQNQLNAFMCSNNSQLHIPCTTRFLFIINPIQSVNLSIRTLAMHKMQCARLANWDVHC